MSQTDFASAYAPHTILRYYPSDGSAHYTAIVLNDEGHILEVKQGAVKVKRDFDNVDSWLESLPTHPSISELIVNQKRELNSQDEEDEEDDEKEQEVKDEKKEKKEKVKKEKKVKEKKEKPLKLHLIPQSQHIQSTYWTIHLHRIIKEANPTLLKRHDVIEAFNGLVDVLLENQSHVYSIIPITMYKYSEGVNIDANPVECPLKGMCRIRLNSIIRNEGIGRSVIRHHYYEPVESKEVKALRKEQESVISDSIVEVYRKLFILIRSDVIPYMERMSAEKMIKQNSKKVEVVVNRMERAQEVYERELDRRLRLIGEFKKNHERHMNIYRDQLNKLSS